MATSPIDLSKIPVPDAVEVPDSRVIFNTWLTELQTLDTVFDALVASDPAWKQGEVLSYQTVLYRQRMNDSIRAVLLASAKGADLDQVGATFNVERLLITPGDDTAVPPVDPVYEDDDAFRVRIQLSWSQLSTAGAEDAYTFFASSADPDVLDVRPYGPETHELLGEVYLYVLSRTGDGTAPQALLDTVAAAVNKKEVRPLTDLVTIMSAIIVPFEIVADICIPYGVDTETVMQQARDELDMYTANVRRIGNLVSCSAIDHALHQPGVKTVRLTSPAADIEMIMGEAPYCTSVTLNKVIINGE